MKTSFSVRIQVSQGRIRLVWSLLEKKKKKNRQWSAFSHAVSQQNQAVYSGLHYLARRPSSQPQQFALLPTNHPQAPHLLSPRDSAAGSHSSGMNLSRLEHSAKGHYPGLHVCWVAVLSNSTRCCCDHWVTCEGRKQLHFIQLFIVTSQLFWILGAPEETVFGDEYSYLC